MIANRWPWMAVFLLILVMDAAIFLDNIGANGTFVYGLDDAYIHLAIAKTLAEHGVWGISPNECVSASSSPLWTLILAFFHRLFGSAEMVPLVVNLLCSLAVLCVGDGMVCRHGPSCETRPWLRFGFLVALALVIPLPALWMLGMEHLLHALLAIMLLSSCADLLWPDGNIDAIQPFRTALIVVLGVSARYETLFLLVPVVGILLWRRAWRTAYILVAASVAPIVIFGIYYEMNGATFIPVSILIKTLKLTIGTPPEYQGIPLGRMLAQFANCPSLLVLAMAGILALGIKRTASEAVSTKAAGAAGLVTVGMFLHAQFAGTGWFFRYEAYLIALGMLTTLPVLVSGLFRRMESRGNGLRMLTVAGYVLLSLAFWQLGLRAVIANRDTPYAYRNIGSQQIQMARFLAHWQGDTTVALNDVGAVSYFTDIHILDLVGMTSQELHRIGMNRTIDSQMIDTVARQAGAELAILYPFCFEKIGGVPASWTPVAEWKIRDNVICATDTVTIYAISSGTRASLEQRLKAFTPNLPDGVSVMFSAPPPP